MTTDAGRDGVVTGRVAGKVALITGAARGLGRSHAVRLAREGADIIGVDICSDVVGIPYPLASPDDLDETARLAEEAGARVVTAQVDVRDPDALALAVSRGVDRLSRLDIAVANAGSAVPGPFLLVDDAGWRFCCELNIIGTASTFRHAARAMTDGGSLIAISTAASNAPEVGMAS